MKNWSHRSSSSLCSYVVALAFKVGAHQATACTGSKVRQSGSTRKRSMGLKSIDLTPNVQKCQNEYLQYLNELVFASTSDYLLRS